MLRIEDSGVVGAFRYATYKTFRLRADMNAEHDLGKLCVANGHIALRHGLRLLMSATAETPVQESGVRRKKGFDLKFGSIGIKKHRNRVCIKCSTILIYASHKPGF
ncbi:hypothetical protein AFK68_28625 [Hydrocoleum sp. CS-953]|nr:hypothetical protein AFK68_28625 [Hydrocoleum sp. CS-953]